MSEFEGSPTALVADVDCTAGGESLCSKHEVGGYPTLKYGDPTDLQDYQGGRSFDDLKTFAENNLGPQCGPGNLDLCSEELQAKYKKFMGMSVDRLAGRIRN